MSDITPEQLDEIEINVELFLAYQNAPLSEYIDAADVLALVAALREAWAERGRVVGVQRLRDVTLTTYERDNASDEATGGGG